MPQPINRSSTKTGYFDSKSDSFLFDEEVYETQLGVNSGVLNTDSNIFDMKRPGFVAMQVVQASGTITSAVATLFHSVDGVNFIASSFTQTNAGIVVTSTPLARYVRVRFTTASGVASNANLFLSSL